MPEVSQYTFPLREVAEVLVKNAGITEGKWIVGVNFSLNIGNMGPNPLDVKPTLMASVDSVNIARADPNMESNGLVIDASKLTA